MKKIWHYFLQCLVIFFVTIVSHGGETEEGGRFRLLSEIQNGVTYVKDPCRSEAFSLVFSFSEELRGTTVGEEVAFVSFSEGFEDFLKAQHAEMKAAALYARAAEKIGSRQLRVDYVAKIVRDDGTDANLELPDQIEVVILNDDLSRVLDRSNRPCERVPNHEREMTLLLSNPSEKCGRLTYPH